MNFLRAFVILTIFIVNCQLNKLVAQTNPPDAFVYQGLAKNPGTGGIATNTKVRLKVQVLRGSAKGTLVYEEVHNTTTNSDGIFSVLVGHGQRVDGTTYSSLYDIPWSQDSFYFSLSISIGFKYPINRYSSYFAIGAQQFFSVPYAMFAKEAQSILDTIQVTEGGNYRYLQLGSQKPVIFYIGDGDTSALNELQELVGLGGRIGLKSPSGQIEYSVTLPDSSSSNELQQLSQSGNTITLSQGGGSVSIVDNDKQTLSITGQSLKISGGNAVNLPDKDQQTLSLSGNNLSISNGNSVTINTNDADADPNNEIQTISKSGSTITLNKSGGSITDSDNQNLSVSGSSLTISSGNSVTLPDGSSTNELQTLSKSGSTISLSNSGGSVTDSDNQNLSLSGSSLSISSGNTVTLPDASSTNEIQTISKSGSTISLSNNGGSVTDSDNQNLSISGATLSISSANSVTLPDASATNELQNLNEVLTKGNNANNLDVTGVDDLSAHTVSTNYLYIGDPSQVGCWRMLIDSTDGSLRMELKESSGWVFKMKILK
jgi:hypothetical protein